MPVPAIHSRTLEPGAKSNAATAFGGGAIIGALGGLIGLGGAEFRLPLLIGAFGFPALEAVILNKAMSLISSHRRRAARPSRDHARRQASA